MADHSLLVCVQELIRLRREGKLVSAEAFGHIVDILTAMRALADGTIMPLTAEDENALEDAVNDLAMEMGVAQALLRRRPAEGGPAVALPARGMLLQLIIQMLGTWASDPENQQKLLDWLFSLFAGGTTQPS